MNDDKRLIIGLLYKYIMRFILVKRDEITLEYIKQIERLSPLHDIGKVGVADGILLKPGKLTTEEFEEMKKHTTYGAAVLRTAEESINKHKKCLLKLE